jgi:Flp pilus assembly protein TadG
LEAVIIVPSLLMFIALLVFAGRAALAHQSVEQAAWDAARTASIARTAGEAGGAARTTAVAVLKNQGLTCSPTVVVDTSQFARPVAVAAEVTAVVACTVDLADLVLPGVPGAVTLTAQAASALDTYRERP